MSFYVFLPSNDKTYAENSANDFRVRLKDPLNLGPASYEVALVELICRGIQPSSDNSASVFSQSAKTITYYHTSIKESLLSTTPVLKKVWNCEDLEAYIYNQPPAVVLAEGETRLYHWFLRNTGQRTLHVEIPNAFLVAFAFQDWLLVKGRNASDFDLSSINELDVLVTKMSMKTVYAGLMSIGQTAAHDLDAADRTFHVVLGANQALKFLGQQEIVTGPLNEDPEIRSVLHTWQVGRSWQFKKRYLSDSGVSTVAEVGNRHMYCYTDIIDYQAVGSTSVPLLRVVDLQRKGAEGGHEDSALINPYYLRVNRQSINEISIRLADQRGSPIRFDPGSHSVAVLHFRPRMD